GCRTAPLEDARLALCRDRDDEVDERGRDDRERGEPGDVVRRRLDLLGPDSVVAEDADEDDQEEDRHDQREEPALPVAKKRDQVVAGLVENEAERSARTAW